MCLFFASHTTLSITVLRTLLGLGLHLDAVVAPTGTRSSKNADDDIPVYRSDKFDSVCETAGVALIEVDGIPTLDLLDELSNGNTKYIVCVCFPLQLPPALLQFPTHGCLNLHPSLLPAYRGPAPTFWQLRAGERSGGITLHYMNQGLDTGDVVAKRMVEIPMGISARELERDLGIQGAELIQQTLAGPINKTSPQDETTASYFSWPEKKDFEIDTSWSAERVFRFMRGTRETGQHHSIEIEGERFLLVSALRYTPDAVLGKQYEKAGTTMSIQFASGVVEVVVASLSVSRCG